MSWKDYFKDGKEIIVSTCSKNKPNSCIAVSLGLSKETLSIANCYMKTTVRNLKENSSVCIIGGHYRAIGNAKIYTKGNCFEECSSILSKQDKNLKLKSAIAIKINRVDNLENSKRVY
jgi:hypothetical protein